MANVDTSSILGVKPLQIENPMNQYAMMSQIQAGQNQNALAQYQLSSAKRADEAQNIQNQLYAKHYDAKTGKVNQSGLLADLAQNPNAAGLIPKLQAQFSDQQHKENVNAKTVAETSKITYEQEIKKNDKAIAHIASLSNPQEALASINNYVKKGEIEQDKANVIIQSLKNTPNFNGWKKTTLMGILDAKDRLHQEYQDKMAIIAGGNLAVNQGQLGVSQANLAINQEKAKREQTMGTIPAGYRLAADGKSLELMAGGPTAVALPPKELQKREAAYPTANLAVKTVEAKSKTLLEDINLLKNHPGLNDMTGAISGRMPVFTPNAMAAKAIYDRIVSRGGFTELQDMRKASPTGGALGNVSNQEGQELRNAWAAISRVQTASDLRKQLDRAGEDLIGSTKRIREAFDETYDYRNNANAGTSTGNVDALLEKYK
jgi:hypothetical protein